MKPCANFSRGRFTLSNFTQLKALAKTLLELKAIISWIR